MKLIYFSEITQGFFLKDLIKKYVYMHICVCMCTLYIYVFTHGVHMPNPPEIEDIHSMYMSFQCL